MLILARTWTRTIACSSGWSTILTLCDTDMHMAILSCSPHGIIQTCETNVLIVMPCATLLCAVTPWSNAQSICRQPCFIESSLLVGCLFGKYSHAHIRLSYDAYVQVFSASAQVAQQWCSVSGVHGTFLLQLTNWQHHESNSEGDGAHPEESPRDPVRGVGRHQVSHSPRGGVVPTFLWASLVR